MTGGNHTITIAFREDGAKLDKICISNSVVAPIGLGEEAVNICDPMGMENPTEIPDSYGMEQNYPNPFNPTTSINYFIPEKSKVTLDILDITGRSVATLINNVENMGEHTITFDGSGLSSGIYFYRIVTSTGFMQSKKMVLIK